MFNYNHVKKNKIQMIFDIFQQVLRYYEIRIKTSISKYKNMYLTLTLLIKFIHIKH